MRSLPKKMLPNCAEPTHASAQPLLPWPHTYN